MKRTIEITVTLIAVACGGSNKGAGSTVAITMSPTSATVAAGATQQFTATVTGSSNTAVTWALQEGAGGSIDSGGLYTAPAGAGDFHVVATAAADPSKQAGATVSVTSDSRTVAGTFSTTYTKDDGTQTTVPGLNPNQPAVNQLLYPNGAGDYTAVDLTVAADGTFSVPAVPSGTYYLMTRQVSFPLNVTGQQAQSVLVTLSPLTSSSPDFSTVVHGRADAVVPTQATPVTLNVTGLAPWSTTGRLRDALFVTPTQDLGDENVFLLARPLPTPGTTSLTVTFDWPSSAFDGIASLPDAAKGDSTYFYHRTHQAMPNGCDGTVSTRFARSTTFTVPPGGGITASIDLQAAPLSSSISTAANLSQFAALVPSMNPSASLTPDSGLLTTPAAGAGIFAIPGRLAYPDFPGFRNLGRVATYDYFGSLSADTDCGTLAYGGFLDANFQTMRNFSYQAGLVLSADGRSIGLAPSFTAEEPAEGVTTAVTPVIGPVGRPLINGQDAFVARTGVGPTPTLSWSAPSLGLATDYSIQIEMLSAPDGPDDIGEVVVGLHGGTSFKVPAGMLKAGKTYAAFITALDQAAQDPNKPFRSGLPIYSADAVTNTFTP